MDLQFLENEIEPDADSLEDLLIRLEEYNLLRKALAALMPIAHCKPFPRHNATGR